MAELSRNGSRVEETDADRRRGILSPDVLSLEIVSALAGDRQLTPAEGERLRQLEKKRGLSYYSDLLYSITHHYFPPEAAKKLWAEVLQHKFTVSKSLGRNVRIAVAALDYLSNITANMSCATLVSEAQIHEIVALSFRDGLTGLFNQTYFFQQIDLEMRRFTRYAAPLSLLLIDIDDFKKVNDEFGHLEGDRILASMGRTLPRTARDSDICCRYGGEEFAAILPMTGVPESGALAGRLHQEMKERLSSGGTVTVSIGVASCGKTTRSYVDLVRDADAALYEAKKCGKDRVVQEGVPIE